HVVGLGALDLPLLGDVAAEDVAAADHQRDLAAERGGRQDLGRDVLARLLVEDRAAAAGHRAAAQLDHDALVAGYVILVRRCPNTARAPRAGCAAGHPRAVCR